MDERLLCAKTFTNVLNCDGSKIRTNVMLSALPSAEPPKEMHRLDPNEPFSSKMPRIVNVTPSAAKTMRNAALCGFRPLKIALKIG